VKLAVIQKTGIEPRILGLIEEDEAEILVHGGDEASVILLSDPADLRAVVSQARSSLGIEGVIVEHLVTMLPYHETTVDLSAVAEYTVLSLEGQDGSEPDRIVVLYQKIREQVAAVAPKKERRPLSTG
jgi:RNase P/RNase MRP subunit p29